MTCTWEPRSLHWCPEQRCTLRSTMQAGQELLHRAIQQGEETTRASCHQVGGPPTHCQCSSNCGSRLRKDRVNLRRYQIQPQPICARPPLPGSSFCKRCACEHCQDWGSSQLQNVRNSRLAYVAKHIISLGIVASSSIRAYSLVVSISVGRTL